MSTRGLLFAAACIAAAASGCNCGDPNGGTCRTSAECPRGQVCERGRCVPYDGDAGPTPPDTGARRDAYGDAGTCAVGGAVVASAPVDIIIVVDQSASTGEEQDAISTNLSSRLVTALESSGLDYRVIIINSDPRICPAAPLGNPAAGCLTSNPPRYYRVAHPVNNSDELTLILWTYDGEGKRPNSCQRVPDPALRWSDYLRMDSQKVFVVFSDDDPSTYSRAGGEISCSSGGIAYGGCSYPACPTLDCPAVDWGTVCPNFGCPTFADRPADWTGGRSFPEELYALEPAGMFGTAEDPRWVFHSIIGLPDQRDASLPLAPRCSTCDFSGNTAEASGIEYQRLSILTGGIRFPSCNTDYSPIFDAIASTIIPLACEFVVTPTTVPGVTLDPDLVNVEYTTGAGATTTILQDQSRPCLGGADGWQWNADFTRIRLCGNACTAVQGDPDGEVRITVGCMTEIRPPD
jgi:hypothetical protein